MSDRPAQNDQPTTNGGWHSPEVRGSWREVPPKDRPNIGWRVPTLPRNLQQQPTEEGAWHLPAPEDTSFKPDDQIVILGERPEDVAATMVAIAPTPAAGPRPEDLLLEAQPTTRAAPAVSAAARPEDEILNLASAAQQQAGLVETPQVAPRPEDEILAAATSVAAEMERTGTVNYFDLDAAADEAEDDSAFSMSELMALQSLMGDEAAPAVTPPLSDSQPTVSDPQSYAAAALAALEAEDSAAPTLADSSAPVQQPAATAPTAAAAADPGEYARQQLEALRTGELGSELGATAAPASTQPWSPDLTTGQMQLAQQFERTEQQVRTLRAARDRGELSNEQLQEQLRALMVLDDQNIYWMMGVESDQWYKYEDETWKIARPPLLDALKPPAGYTPPTAGAAPRVSYFETSGQQPAATAGDVFIDEYNMMPRQGVPTQDPNLTQIGASYLKDQQTIQQPTYAQPTIVSSYEAEPTLAGATVVSGAAYEGIPSPMEPAYDAEPAYDTAEAEGEIFKAAAARRRSSTTRNLIFAGVAVLTLLFLGGAGFILLTLSQYNTISGEWTAQIENLNELEFSFQNVTIQDATGATIARLSSSQGAREEITLDQVSPYMIHAVISSENARFYEDGGWDLFRIIDAFYGNLVAGEIQSGASTITQQVARILIINPSGRQFTSEAERKLHELVIANEIATRYSKNEILALYLNNVFFGNLSTGVEAAAQFYFEKPASELTAGEAALLTAIIPRPADRDPVNRAQLAGVIDAAQAVVARQLEVGCLQFQHGNWLAEGEFCITGQSTAQDANGQVFPLFRLRDGNLVYNNEGDIEGGLISVQFSELETTVYLPRNIALRYPHFVDYIRLEVERLYGSDEMFRRGFTIRTTLNPAVQDAAETAMTQYFNTGQVTGTGIDTGAILVVDPRSGEILAMVGSPDFTNTEIDGQFNNVFGFNQPGSTIKPITYTAALSGVDKNGDNRITEGEYYTPATILWDVQYTYPDGTPIRNFSGQFSGPVPMRNALQRSLNVPAVKAYEFIGEAAFRNFAGRMGIAFPENATFSPATALGATDVQLFGMVTAYSTIANDGLRPTLRGISRITTAEGEDVTPQYPGGEQAIAPEVAFLMQTVMSDDNTRAPEFALGGPLTINGLARQNVVAAKTGTTDGGRDLWTVGFTHNITVGVWLGTFDNSETTASSSSFLSAPLWNTVMTNTLNIAAYRPREQFSQPNSNAVVMQICPSTGALFGDGSNCPDAALGEYVLRNQPPTTAGFVAAVPVNSWTGLLANDFCPNQEDIVTLQYVNIPDISAINWLRSPAGQPTANRLRLPASLQPAPTAGCDGTVQQPNVSISAPFANQTLSETVSLTGIVNAGTAFARYQLEAAEVNAQQYGIIRGADGQPQGPFTNQQPNANSPLGTWDTRTVPNGTYDLRVAVYAQNGGFVFLYETQSPHGSGRLLG